MRSHFSPIRRSPGQKALDSGMAKLSHAIHSGGNSVIGAPNR